MNKEKAIKELVKYDHIFLSPLGAKEFSKPFGLEKELPLRNATDTRSEHKGLKLNNKKEGEKAVGIDADELACWIAKKIGAKYYQMLGRGSALRECCRAIREKIKE